MANFDFVYFQLHGIYIVSHLMVCTPLFWNYSSYEIEILNNSKPLDGKTEIRTLSKSSDQTENDIKFDFLNWITNLLSVLSTVIAIFRKKVSEYHVGTLKFIIIEL